MAAKKAQKAQKLEEQELGGDQLSAAASILLMRLMPARGSYRSRLFAAMNSYE
jgi:hypothetical protein